EGLVADLHRLRPSLVVNSGDFTQRARRRQYRDAAAFMKRLPAPQLSVPGNHDIPLYDVLRRFLWPLNRFRTYITEEPYPGYADEEIAVFGINTARSMTWKSGRISMGQMQEMERLFSGLPPSVIKVVVTHHPFIPPPGEEGTGVDLVGRAASALKVLGRAGVDLMLAGHLHHGYTGDIRTFYPLSKRSIIVAQSGTAISNRVRHEPNGYNFIRLENSKIEIEVRSWDGKVFAGAGRRVFALEKGQWLSTV
ncbi:MAG: metallophosphoesterase, partial [Balneolales bacterium]